jgi:putative ABC transport system permease protein
MSFYLAAIMLGLAFSSMGLGIYISMRIFNIPDITTDGSYTLGGVITAVMLSHNYPMPIVIICCIAGGALAGMATGFIHSKLKVNALLSGILVMTSLYSINLLIMGRSNIPLLNTPNIFNSISFINDITYQQFIIILLFIIILWSFTSWLLKTDFGIAMRATGNSETMIRALGVNTNAMKIIGLAIANALTALSGFLIVQYQGFADINMGIGIVILGLGSVMIGEMLVNWMGSNSIMLKLAGVIIGSILFRLILAFTLSIGMNPILLQLVTASCVLIVVGLPNLKRSK